MNIRGFKRVSLILAVLVLSLGCLACGEESLRHENAQMERADKQTAVSETVRVIVTQAFGQDIMHDEQISYNENYAVIDYLEEICDVETAYGGGFVNGIDGLVSGFTSQNNKVKKDWFFYANGIFSHVGALEYYPLAGEVIQWDYHEWENSSNSSAILTGWPEVFNTGYDGLQADLAVVYTPEYETISSNLANELELQGIPIELAPYNDHINLGEEGHTVLLTGKAQMLENGFMLKMLETYRERGIFLGAEDGGLMAYSGDYTVSRPLDKEAVLFSYQKIYGHPDTLFVIGGDSINYVETLVNTLIQSPDQIIGKSGVVLGESGLSALPLITE